MSETEDLEIPAEELPPSEPKPKPKKIMSELQLEKLKLAREKAAQVKRAAKAEKDKVEQELKETEKAKRLAKLKEKVEKSHIDLNETPPQEPQKEDTEIKVNNRDSKKSKKKVVVMHDSGSDSDSDTQVIYIPRKKKIVKPSSVNPDEKREGNNRSNTAPSNPPPAFGHMPRYQLHNFNHNSHFY